MKHKIDSNSVHPSKRHHLNESLIANLLARWGLFLFWLTVALLMLVLIAMDADLKALMER